jgi:hypothetical protein
MRATIDSISFPAICDTIRVELHQSSSPYLTSFIDTQVIGVNGAGVFSFPSDVFGGNYYISIHHRNALETWSAGPVAFTDSIVQYSFADSLAESYGSTLYDLGDGNFALWSGDIAIDSINSYGLQDGYIQSQDYFYFEQALFVTSLGYVPADLTGDGVVESLDYMYMENSYAYLISTVHP